MKKNLIHSILAGLITAVVALTMSLAVVPHADAASKTRCAKNSGSYSGRCWQRSTIYKKLKVAEAVPLENKSKRTITAHCSFSRTITRSFTAGADLGYEAKASLFKLVDVGTSVTLHFSVSQTAAQATDAGASVVLKPGQRVTCQRTYGYVTTKIRDYTYTGTKISNRYYAINIPAYIGVRVVN